MLGEIFHADATGFCHAESACLLPDAAPLPRAADAFDGAAH